MIDARLGDDMDLMPYNYFVTGDELIIQRVNIRLRTGRDEWVFDITAGYPLLDWASRRGLPPSTVTLLVKEDLENIPGVLRMDVKGSFDSKERLFFVTGRGLLASGAQIGINASPTDIYGKPTATVSLVES